MSDISSLLYAFYLPSSFSSRFFLFSLISLCSTEPYTEYRIVVIAFTLKYDGEPSDSVTLRTDIPGPSAPQIINLTCHSQDALFIHWKRPSTFYNSIDSYVINYKESIASKFDELKISTNSSIPDTWVSFITFLPSHFLAKGRASWWRGTICVCVRGTLWQCKFSNLIWRYDDDILIFNHFTREQYHSCMSITLSLSQPMPIVICVKHRDRIRGHKTAIIE